MASQQQQQQPGRLAEVKPEKGSVDREPWAAGTVGRVERGRRHRRQWASLGLGHRFIQRVGVGIGGDPGGDS